jgi:hypothetical protein
MILELFLALVFASAIVGVTRYFSSSSYWYWKHHRPPRPRPTWASVRRDLRLYALGMICLGVPMAIAERYDYPMPLAFLLGLGVYLAFAVLDIRHDLRVRAATRRA